MPESSMEMMYCRFLAVIRYLESTGAPVPPKDDDVRNAVDVVNKLSEEEMFKLVGRKPSET